MDRRNFLKAGAAGIAMTALSPLGAAAKGVRADKGKRRRKGRLNLTWRPYELQLKHSFNLASSQRTTTPDVLVEIEYDGITGYGEASMPPYLGESTATVQSFLSQLDLGQFADPYRLDDIHDYMDGIADGNRAAKAAVDIALHDLLGKAMGQPWHRIWGLNPDTTPCTSYTVSYDTDPAEQQAKIAEALPYKVIKVKMGLDHDRELVEAIRRRTDAPLCVDVNQGWDDREAALDLCHWLNEQGCLFVEQPFAVSRYDDTAWLRERSPLPIVGDESVQRLSDVRRASHIFDGINIKLMKSTGMHEAYKMAVMAKGLGMKVMLGCMTETSCAVSAMSQLAPMADWADLDGNLLIANDCFDGMKICDGKVTLNRLPGIGVRKV